MIARSYVQVSYSKNVHDKSKITENKNRIM